MGEPWTGPKRVARPLRCAWCGRVRVGTIWQPERRSESAVLYSHGICPRCAADYFSQYLPGINNKSEKG